MNNILNALFWTIKYLQECPSDSIQSEDLIMAEKVVQEIENALDPPCKGYVYVNGQKVEAILSSDDFLYLEELEGS